jgi:hypothetical protein
VNPVAGVLAPAPGRLPTLRLRRPDTAERIRYFLAQRLPAARRSADLILPLAALSLISVLGTLAAPLLRRHPLLVVALSPRLPFLVLAAPRAGLVPFVVVGTVRLCLADPFHFRLGQRLGAARPPRWTGHRLARPVSGAAVLLRPNGRHLALAGALRLRGGVVAALDIAGTVGFLLGVHGVTALFH